MWVALLWIQIKPTPPSPVSFFFAFIEASAVQLWCNFCSWCLRLLVGLAWALLANFPSNWGTLSLSIVLSARSMWIRYARMWPMNWVGSWKSFHGWSRYRWRWGVENSEELKVLKGFHVALQLEVKPAWGAGADVNFATNALCCSLFAHVQHAPNWTWPRTTTFKSWHSTYSINIQLHWNFPTAMPLNRLLTSPQFQSSTL